jgi:hypothetical protein
MSRLVQPASRDTTRGYEAKSRGDADEYQDRVAKYIPAEVVGGYVSLDGISAKWGSTTASLQMIHEALAQDAPTRSGAGASDLVGALTASASTWAGIIFLFCLVLAPLYVWTLARRAGTSVWKAQALIATLAFVVWAYAIKGNVFFANTPLDNWAWTVYGKQFYQPEVGAALLVLFSLAVAFYQPKAN